MSILGWVFGLVCDLGWTTRLQTSGQRSTRSCPSGTRLSLPGSCLYYHLCPEYWLLWPTRLGHKHSRPDWPAMSVSAYHQCRSWKVTVTVWSLSGCRCWISYTSSLHLWSKYWLLFLSDYIDSHRAVAGGRCDLLIFDSRLLWQIVSNAADKSTATQIVRSGGVLWLYPIAISVVICSRAEMVEWSALKPCWSGAGWRYLLIVDRIRDSSTFADAQWDFHIAGIWQVVTERLNRAVMYLMALGPRFLQVEDAEFVRAKGLTIPTALDCSPH